MGILIFLILAGVVILAAAVVSAVVLGVGVLLSAVFPVDTFQASILVVAVGGVIVWAIAGVPAGGDERELGQEDMEPTRVWLAPFPLHQPGGGRKRKK